MGKKKISLARVVQVAQGEWNILWEGMGIFLEQYGYERAEKESEADWLVTGYPIEEKKLNKAVLRWASVCMHGTSVIPKSAAKPSHSCISSLPYLPLKYPQKG